MQIQDSSQMIPLPGVHTLFLDVKTPEDITDSKVLQPPQNFIGFQLHRVILTGVNPLIAQVAIPHLQGSTASCWTPMQKQVLPPELEEAPQVTAALAVADPDHWNIMNDPIYPSCLDIFRARHEASMALETATSAGRASSQGESSTPTQQFLPSTLPLPPPTPTLDWQEVDVWVTEVMDQVHDLNLQLLQEMGFIREINQALSKSLRVEFLRLQVLIGEDLGGTLWTWQANMEAATDKFLRDLDAATQVSTTLPSQNAAVGVALCQF